MDRIKQTGRELLVFHMAREQLGTELVVYKFECSLMICCVVSMHFEMLI